MFFLVLVYVFNCELFEISAAILEKGLLPFANKIEYWDIHIGGEINSHEDGCSDHSWEMFSISYCNDCC